MCKFVQHRDVMKYSSSAPMVKKQESVTCKFTTSCTSPHRFFKEFEPKFRTAILKNTSRWLLLKATIFWEHS